MRSSVRRIAEIDAGSREWHPAACQILNSEVSALTSDAEISRSPDQRVTNALAAFHQSLNRLAAGCKNGPGAELHRLLTSAQSQFSRFAAELGRYGLQP
jgi:hypothetical protein